ncbi:MULTISPECIES: hypothetical protein [Erwinia]|uniref:Uncharacterized protein n=1 Tax=Erwinia aeris TaxID=3239803 RepID=A0ABV4E4J4_9GAMM|nr:hypothetical protein [Erwinia persicina]
MTFLHNLDNSWKAFAAATIASLPLQRAFVHFVVVWPPICYRRRRLYIPAPWRQENPGN